MKKTEYLKSKKRAERDNFEAFASESGILMRAEVKQTFDSAINRIFKDKQRTPKSWKGWSNLSKKHK